MNIVIAGSRTFSDYSLLCRTLDEQLWPETRILSGTAAGADQLGERYASEHGMEVLRFPADWKKHGRAAGPIRNEQMLANADGAIFFWDGRSRGTAHAIGVSQRLELPYLIVRF